MIQGYCVPLSVSPGRRIEFKVSSTSDYSVTYLRLKRDASGNVGHAMMEPLNMGAAVQDTPTDAWRTGRGWNTSFALEIPVHWESGHYAAECVDVGGERFDIVFILRPQETRLGNVAILANTNTWNAYNGWGGGSKYDGAPVGSFERPCPVATPLNDGEINHLTRAELWIANWLEDAGYGVDLYSDSDFHKGIRDLQAYRVLILNTHPEYWTIEMLDNLENYLANGGSLAYLGGNGVFESCELPDNDNVAIFWGGVRPQGIRPWISERLPHYFRNLSPNPRPERGLLGVAFLFNNHIDVPAKPGPYAVALADHRVFNGRRNASGARLGTGDLIGSTGLNHRANVGPDWGAASGWEMDASYPASAPDGTLVNRQRLASRGRD